MKRFMLAAAIATALTLVCAGRAEARIFEPQHNWWHAGRTCVESRNPPGLAWDDLPPRACVAREDIAQRKPPREEFLTALKNDVWTIAFVSDERAGKTPAKIWPLQSEVFAEPVPGA
jgi:hypothetical protein